ncbi:MAG: serine/threonine-protein kinase [Oculatellaceae cyanobacterium bins.114]|nr:serine/threonine-protein kinase [Oculatellaceae cyanobacterium bins.114]
MVLVQPSNPATTISPQSLSPDHLWQERYQIIKPLGQGGFGATYLAIDTHHADQAQCVIKQLKPFTESGFSSADETQRRFQREVNALKQLGHHDQIPQLLDHVEVNGELYLVQEFIAGRSLEQELTLNTDNTDPSCWSEPQVIQLLQDVSQVLAFVHSQGMIHRDIKPSNLMRRQLDHRFVLIDFGAIAPIHPSADLAPDQPSVTLAIHTEGYTPIEQLRGKPCPASDFYALGMVAIQALTGLHPREFEETLSLKDITWFQTAQVSAGLIAVLVTMTRRCWSDRYQTAEKVLQDLQDLVGCSLAGVPDSLSLLTQQATPTTHAGAAIEYTPTQVTTPTPAETPPSASPLPSPLPPTDFHLTGTHSRSPVPPADSPPSPLLLAKNRWKRLFTPRLCSLLMGVGLISMGACILVGLIAGWQVGEGRSPQESVEASPLPIKFLLTTLTAKAAVRSIAFDAADQTLVGGLADHTTVRWDIALAQPIQTFTSHFSPVTVVVVSPEGQLLATGGEDTNITLWNLQTGELLHTLRGHCWSILSLALSPDAHTLVSSSDDHTVRFWDVTTGKLLHTLTDFQEPFLSMDISLDGSMLVGGSANNTITVWNAHTQAVLRTLRGHSDQVNSVAISANGAVLVSGSADHTVKVWNLYTGEMLHSLTGHRDTVNAVAISPNGRFLVSGSADQTIKIWDLYSGELIDTLRDRTTEISAIAISPDGKTLASAGLDGTVKIWQMPNSEV